MSSKKKSKKDEKNATREYIMSKFFEKNEKKIIKKFEKFDLRKSTMIDIPYIRNFLTKKELKSLNMYTDDEICKINDLTHFMSNDFIKEYDKKNKHFEKKLRKFFKKSLLPAIKYLLTSDESDKFNKIDSKFSGEFRGKE